ncbi:hypothetical protein PIB30_017652 [Stylosanthes scabra]|uniref:Uncharacterized protein n=1 Tax=Stylosanthes scabra TaxID=79078 RepID=A0ABU6X562_9FABA|nr:hypothetical protein [Stylosanthes scabra]
MRRLTTRNPTLLKTSPNMVFHLHQSVYMSTRPKPCQSTGQRIYKKGMKAGIRYKWETVSAWPRPCQSIGYIYYERPHSYGELTRSVIIANPTDPELALDNHRSYFPGGPFFPAPIIYDLLSHQYSYGGSLLFIMTNT